MPSERNLVALVISELRHLSGHTDHIIDFRTGSSGLRDFRLEAETLTILMISERDLVGLVISDLRHLS